jgi:hypothetical protein
MMEQLMAHQFTVQGQCIGSLAENECTHLIEDGG